MQRKQSPITTNKSLPVYNSQNCLLNFNIGPFWAILFQPLCHFLQFELRPVQYNQKWEILNEALNDKKSNPIYSFRFVRFLIHFFEKVDVSNIRKFRDDTLQYAKKKRIKKNSRKLRMAIYDKFMIMYFIFEYLWQHRCQLLRDNLDGSTNEILDGRALYLK